MPSKLGYQDIEWQSTHVWGECTPPDMPVRILHFPEANIDIAEVKEAINTCFPLIVVPAPGKTFTDATMNAHLIRNDSKYHTGILVPGTFDELNKHIKWAVAQGFGPIVLTPPNFYGNQDKELWQMHQHGVWITGAWYHLATARPHALHLPGRWTVGDNFVNGARQ